MVIFNPETSRYETISSKEFDLKIQEKKSNSSIDSENERAQNLSTKQSKGRVAVGVPLHAPKKLSHFRHTSIQNYSHTLSNPNLLIRLVRDSYFNLYLLALVIILNLIGYSPSILRIIQKFAERKRYEKFPFKEYEKFILKNTNVSDISNKIKSLYSQVDLEQNINDKVPALDHELFEEFNRFIENTDRINYGIKKNLDAELISSDLKERALKILKGLKRLYE